MCEYCGCQRNPVIAELTAEHDRLRELSRALAAVLDTVDVSAAGEVAAQMLTVLGPHTQVEEDGLFPPLAADFGDHLDHLVAEHRAIDAALRDVASGRTEPGWQQRTHHALADLFDHILKEQDGVFPAALAALSAGDWDALDAARDRAHGAAEAPAAPSPA